MSRLTEKLAAAASVVPRQHAKIEARADAIIAREAEIEHQTDAAFLPHELLLDEAENGLAALAHDLATTSNSPPLSGSTGSFAARDEVHEAAHAAVAAILETPPATQQPGSTSPTEPGV
jgi:hypothetical protein